MATMCVVQVSRPNGSFEIVERQIPKPGAGSIRIQVHACGICHSDSLTMEDRPPEGCAALQWAPAPESCKGDAR